MKSNHADSVETSKLDEIIQSCVESDQHEKEEGSNKSAEEKESECVKKYVQEKISDI